MENRLKSKNTNNADVWTAVQHLHKAIAAGGIDPKLLALVHLRASQINGCSACVYASVAGGKKAGDTDERLHNVAAWREAPFYTDAERAALAPAEAATRPQDGAEGVTDEIWEEVNAHFTEERIGAINLEIAPTKYFRMYSRSMVPQRRSISPLTATRLSGSSCLPRGETLIHGWPCFLTIATPPVVPPRGPARTGPVTCGACAGAR